MDNLTHSLVGVFLSRVGLNRLAPDTTPILLLAANAPDVDIISGAGGMASYLHWHRNFTHSILFSPVMAVASVAAVRLVSRRKGNWAGAALAAWVAVLSHLLLDLTNNYGIRLLEPFSGRWFAGDLTYVVDPYLWAALLLAFFVPLLGKLLSSEMGGGRRDVYPARGWAVFALSFLMLFDGARVLLHQRALDTLDARIYSGETPRRVAAFPTPLNPLMWDGLAEISDRSFLYRLDLNAEFDPASGKTLYKNNPGAALPVLRQQRDMGALIAFSTYPLWRVINDANNSRYAVTDLRFGDPVAQTFTCSARLIGLRSAADERCDFTFAPNFGKE